MNFSVSDLKTQNTLFKLNINKLSANYLEAQIKAETSKITLWALLISIACVVLIIVIFNETFTNMLTMFNNPILGVLAGAILTGIIQSSSASVGILQALAATGAVSYGAAIPIIMGQNIGTCVTALLSSVGTAKNARRAALVHLSFNILGTVICLSVFSIVNLLISPAIFDESASLAGIAICHSIFNIACTAILLPMSGLLEKLATITVGNKKGENDKRKGKKSYPSSENGSFSSKEPLAWE